MLDLSPVDTVETVKNAEATARRLAREEGILAGISCGAAVALRLTHRDENAGKTIGVILPDRGERYLGSARFAGLFDVTGPAPNWHRRQAHTLPAVLLCPGGIVQSDP